MNGLLTKLSAIFAMLSLTAFGGANAALPELRRQIVVLQGLMDDQTFAGLVALAQAAPGPNVMISSVVGWKVAGWPGFLVATLAMVAPSSLLAFLTERTMRRWSAHGTMLLLRRALAPVAVGLICASGLVLARAADSGALTLALTVFMSVLCGTTRTNPLFGVAAGAALGGAASVIGFPI
ncbi:chromate transporter [Methylocella sp.]|uniref:chromate transporter n=1 Tax=Methylocella sp. TaxID=1978226 RepID=UPI0035B03C60